MIKPASMTHPHSTQAFHNAQTQPEALCIALRPWGFEESELQSWIRALPDEGGAIAWEISRDRLARSANVVVHLVKPSSRAVADFCWNCAGANYALSKSLAECGIEMVLFSGTANQLPMSRSGHWAMTGRLSPQVALRRLGCLITASSTRDPRGKFTVRRDLLALITRQLDVT